jgi:hypothetical protein
LIVIKTFVPSTPSINHQKPKNILKNRPKQPKLKNLFFFPSLPLEDPTTKPTLLEVDIPSSQSPSKVKDQKTKKTFSFLPSFLPSQAFDPLISFFLSLSLPLSKTL